MIAIRRVVFGTLVAAALSGNACAQSIITQEDIDKMCTYQQGLGGTSLDFNCKKRWVEPRADVHILTREAWTPELKKIIAEHFRLVLQAKREGKP